MKTDCGTRMADKNGEILKITHNNIIKSKRVN